MTCYYTIAIYSLQNVNKHFSEMKNKHQNSLFTTSTVFPVWSLFCMQAKNYDLLPNFSKKYFGITPSIKKIKSQESAEKSRHFLEDSGLK